MGFSEPPGVAAWCSRVVFVLWKCAFFLFLLGVSWPSLCGLSYTLNPILSALTNAVSSTEEERLWGVVKANPADFNAWISLIQETEKLVSHFNHGHIVLLCVKTYSQGFATLLMKL